MPAIPPYAAAEQLELEREMLGLFLSGHPLDAHEAKLAAHDLTPIHYLPETADGSYVAVAGMVAAVKTIINKKGKAMAFIELEDRVDKVEAVVFPEAWQSYAPLLQKGRLVVMQAKLQHNDESVSLLAERASSMDELPDVLPGRAAYRRTPA